MSKIVLSYGSSRRIRVLIPLFLDNRQRGLTVSEILDLLFDGREAGDFYIEPPEGNNLTDEDSDKEDTETGLHPYSLSGNQLRAPAELCSHQNDGADNDEMAVEPVS